ncbi:MAG: DUF4115 domain-containing protein [Acidimicrobiales bacterium]
MTFIIAFGLLALVGVVGVWAWGSRGRDDRSMKTHKETVGTIERIVGRSGVEAGDAANHVRLVGDRPRHSRGDHVAGKRPPEPLPAKVQEAARTRRPADKPQRATVPSGPVPSGPVPPVEDSEPFGEGSPPARRAVHARSQGRVGALIPAAAGAVVVVAAIVVALTVASPSSKPGGAPVTSSKGPAPKGSAVAPLASVPTTTTPSPTTTVVGAVAQTASGYQYQVAGTDVSAVLSASGPCWLEVRGGSASGPALFEATLTSGSTKSFSSPGGLWLRLGAPGSVRLSLQGSDVVLPPVGGPYDITVITSPAG